MMELTYARGRGERPVGAKPLLVPSDRDATQGFKIHPM